MKQWILIGLLIVIAVSLCSFPGCGRDEGGETKKPPGISLVTIGTGGITGVYYPTGGAISRMINAKKDQYGIRCTVESTGGSVFNVNALMAGDLEFGVVQSDCQFQAVHGSGGSEWAGNPQKKLRAVFSVHPETCTLVAAVDAGIRTITDLRGKRVNIGNPGSGQRQNCIDALTAVGIDWEQDIQAEGIKASEAPGLLLDGRIDAFFYTVGHPNNNFKEAAAGKRKVVFVPITGPGIDALIGRLPYYAKAVVPVIGNYPGAANDSDIESFGVKATVVTSADVPDSIVYAVTREVFENLDDFKKLHPAYAGLTKENMLQGLSAPIHPGALTYYREAGLRQ